METTVTNNSNEETKFKVDKTTYDNIVRNIKDTWPPWNVELCNEDLLISVHSEKNYIGYGGDFL